jgi:hypothetical protein
MASAIIGAVGLLAGGIALFYLEGKALEWSARHYWVLGLASLFPAWLAAFLALLPPLTRETAEAPLPPKAILSSGAALLGVIATDYLLRRRQKSERALHPVVCWMIGWAALLPGWLIALVRF